METLSPRRDWMEAELTQWKQASYRRKTTTIGSCELPWPLGVCLGSSTFEKRETSGGNELMKTNKHISREGSRCLSYVSTRKWAFCVWLGRINHMEEDMGNLSPNTSGSTAGTWCQISWCQAGRLLAEHPLDDEPAPWAIQLWRHWLISFARGAYRGILWLGYRQSARGIGLAQLLVAEI